jgi:hypothetical protein
VLPGGALGPGIAQGTFGLFLLPTGRPGRRFTGTGDEDPAAIGLVWCFYTMLNTLKRNDACFNWKFLNDPATVIYRLCNMLTGWAILQTNQDRGKVEYGVSQLKMVIT